MTELDVKWNDALDLFTESIGKPEHEIRAALRDCHCCNEYYEVRKLVYSYIRSLRK
jgi:hypothetical protein